MKKFYLLFLFTCLVQTIFSATEERTVQFKQYVNFIDCQQYGNDVVFGFAFTALTSGFTQETSFKFLLGDPSYASAKCDIPITIEGEEQLIKCYISAITFPLMGSTKFTLPEYIDIYETSDNLEIYLEDVESLKGVPIDIGSECYPQHNFNYIIAQDAPFYIEEDDYGKKIVSVTGTFEDTKGLRLLSDDSDSYTVNLKAFVDSYYKDLVCKIIRAFSNGGEDQFICTVDGQKKVVFFPTIGTIPVENDYDYVYLGIYREVSLVSSFIKLTGMIFLSLLLF